MAIKYNVYCDETCHLENDGQTHMVMGAAWCDAEKQGEIIERMRDYRKEHGLSDHYEIKWTSVSNSKKKFFLDLVDYFFDTDAMHFRAVIADKGQLKHEKYDSNHDEWYYKMYFLLLNNILSPESAYYVYLDIKDTRGGAKVSKLHEVLENANYDFSRKIVKRIQIIRSHEVQLMQLTDLLIGALSYNARFGDKGASEAKLEIIARIKERSGYSLNSTTLLREKKFNLLKWEPKVL